MHHTDNNAFLTQDERFKINATNLHQMNINNTPAHKYPLKEIHRNTKTTKKKAKARKRKIKIIEQLAEQKKS